MKVKAVLASASTTATHLLMFQPDQGGGMTGPEARAAPGPQAVAQVPATADRWLSSECRRAQGAAGQVILQSAQAQ